MFASSKTIMVQPFVHSTIMFASLFKSIFRLPSTVWKHVVFPSNIKRTMWLIRSIITSNFVVIRLNTKLIQITINVPIKEHQISMTFLSNSDKIHSHLLERKFCFTKTSATFIQMEKNKISLFDVFYTYLFKLCMVKSIAVTNFQFSDSTSNR